MGHEDVQAIEALIELTRDQEAHVRDWATFALGTQVEVDTPDLRDALMERVADNDDDTRCEALVGLARRGNRRVLPALQSSFSSDSVCSMEVEAAALIGDPLLLKELVALREWWDVDKRCWTRRSGHAPMPGQAHAEFESAVGASPIMARLFHKEMQIKIPNSPSSS